MPDAKLQTPTPAAVQAESPSGQGLALPPGLKKQIDAAPLAAPASVAVAVPSKDHALVPPSAANPTIEQPVQTKPVPAKPAVQPQNVEQAPAEVPPASTAVASSEEALELPELSDEVAAYMASKHYLSSGERVSKQFALTPDDLAFLSEMDHLVLGGTLTLAEYVLALRDEFPSLSTEQREALIAALLAERFAPLGDALQPSVQEVARAEKFVLPAAPYYAVYTKPLTYSGAAGEIARMVDVQLGGQIRERLRDLMMSRVKGIRIDAQVEEQLGRAVEFGGLGLNPEKARAAVIAMNDIIDRAQLMTEAEYSAWLAADLHQKTEAAKGPAEREPVTDEDGDEIAAIASHMPRPVRDTSSVLALSTEALLKRLTVRLDDEYLKRRLENIVSTRLRDVRSKNEVLLKLMRDSKVGGVGLERKEAERATEQIEEGYREFHALIAEEEKAKLDVQVQEQGKKIEERKKRESEEHARWFEEKVKHKRAEEDSKKEMIQRMKAVSGGATTPMAFHPIDLKEERKEKAAYGELVPAAAPRQSTASAMAAIVTPDTKKPEPPVVTPPPAIRVSAETAKAAAVTAAVVRPRMDDITMVRPRLEGPVQELQGLTLASFRRLGKTPQEAIARIQQKIELLGQESFERRVEGIQAWQASPLQKTYLNLVTDAFTHGTPMAALAEQKRAAGEDAPSAEELNAIITLNGSLHM